jgi:phage-related protein
VPRVEIRAFQLRTGEVPILNWLSELEARQPKVFAKCVARILELSEQGPAMRRPHADSLRDGIRELRIRTGRVHYRILYFFNGQQIVVLSHGITKEGAVPDREIELAIRRRELIRLAPELHTADFELPE